MATIRWARSARTAARMHSGRAPTEIYCARTHRCGRRNSSPRSIVTSTRSTNNSAGYAGFGSFHSDNVEELISLENWRPDEPVQVVLPTGTPPSFGHEFRNAHFLLDPSWTFLNHGAFGGVARIPFESAERWRRFAEEQPLRYTDRILLPNLVHGLRQFSDYVGADSKQISWLPSATTGLNAIIRSTLVGSFAATSLHLCYAYSHYGTATG
jgi:hypothetical protein